MMKKILLLFMCLVLLTSCGVVDKKEVADVKNTEKTVSLEVKDDEGNIIFSNKEIKINENENAFDLTIRILKEEKIPVVFSGPKEMRYIEGINNLFMFDKGPNSGWLYYINNESPTVSAGAYVLKDKDSILWQYTK